MDGDRPIGLAIGAIMLGVLVLLPALVVATFYVFANVYALITGRDFASGTMNVGVFMTGLVVTVALFLLLMAGAVSFVGRALSPKNPKD